MSPGVRGPGYMAVSTLYLQRNFRKRDSHVNFFKFSFELLTEICMRFDKLLSTQLVKNLVLLQHVFSCEFQAHKNLEKNAYPLIWHQKHVQDKRFV